MTDTAGFPKRGLWYRFAGWLVRTFFFGFTGGITVKGVENVPKSGPVIIAPVHLSHLDPPLLGSVCPRQLRFMAKEELFRNPLLSMLIKSLGAFPVKRGESDTSAIKRTIAWLEEGLTVIVFPEGQRGDGVKMGPVQPGTAVLAKKTKALVVPVGIFGTQVIWPRGGKKLKRSPVVVVFGSPFTYADVCGSGAEKGDREAFGHVLAKRIAQACAEAGLPIKTSD